jgi:hypothetical protein
MSAPYQPSTARRWQPRADRVVGAPPSKPYNVPSSKSVGASQSKSVGAPPSKSATIAPALLVAAKVAANVAAFDVLPVHTRIRAYIISAFAIVAAFYKELNMDSCHSILLNDMCKQSNIPTESVHRASQTAQIMKLDITAFESAHRCILRSIRPGTVTHNKFSAQFREGYKVAMDIFESRQTRPAQPPAFAMRTESSPRNASAIRTESSPVQTNDHPIVPIEQPIAPIVQPMSAINHSLVVPTASQVQYQVMFPAQQPTLNPAHQLTPEQITRCVNGYDYLSSYYQ